MPEGGVTAADLERFAAATLSCRVADLDAAFKAAPDAAVQRWSHDRDTLLVAYTEYRRSPQSCRMTAMELARCCHRLTQVVRQTPAEDDKPRQAARVQRPASAAKPIRKQTGRPAEQEQRMQPARPVRGPHPVVRRAMEAKDVATDSPPPKRRRTASPAAEPAAPAAPVASPEPAPQPEPAPAPAAEPAREMPAPSPARKGPKLRKRPPPPPPLPATVLSRSSPAAPPIGLLSPVMCPTPGLMPADCSLEAMEPLSLGGGVAGRQSGFGRFPLSDTDKWRSFLRLHGWVVVGDVASKEKVRSLTEGFWAARASGGVSRARQGTWSADRGWGACSQSGVWTRDGAAHEPWVWEARSVCAPVYASIYKTPELLTTFEGFGAVHTGEGYKGTPWRVDQAPQCTQFESFQGFLSLLPSDEGWSFNVVPGSKKLFAEGRVAKIAGKAVDEKRSNNASHFAIPKHALQEVVCGPVSVHFQPGDFVLWDSRTVHCDQPAPSGPADPPRLCRLTVNVSMMPVRTAAKLCGEGGSRGVADKVLHTRRSCVEEGRATSHHWSCRAKPKTEAAYTYAPPTLDACQLRLAGLLPYGVPAPARMPYSTEPRTVVRSPRLKPSPKGSPHTSPALPPALHLADPREPDERAAAVAAVCATNGQLAERLGACVGRAVAGSAHDACVAAARRAVDRLWVELQQQLDAGPGAGQAAAAAGRTAAQLVDDACRRKVSELCANVTRNPALGADLLTGDPAAGQVISRLLGSVHQLRADGGAEVDEIRRQHFADRTAEAEKKEIDPNETCRSCEQKNCVYYFTIETGGVGKPKPTMVRGCVRCNHHEAC
eukprot:TRINITY_DN1852_c2_g1_i1.p1 TRINITY_DN1852_c2_g1~~TRINITY_DN1852_c2_g1_i1.p1  ORF type:complete len:853 (+),score=245.41 TRINITY_DN1852_c2_g1_i1:78-2561(+)